MKTYVKPDVYYENFEMSQHVATCSWDMSNSKDVNNCSAADELNIPIFTSDNSKCAYSDYEEYCYTNGSSDFKIFNS